MEIPQVPNVLRALTKSVISIHSRWNQQNFISGSFFGFGFHWIFLPLLNRYSCIYLPKEITNIFIHFCLCLPQAKFDIFVKSIKCFDVNPSLVLNYSCKLRPVRNKCSLMNINIFLARIPQVYGRYTLFYKYTGGFRPYILDLNFDACEIMSQKSILWSNKAAIILIKSMKKIYASLFTGCPYKGRYDSTKWFDANESLFELMPPIIPVGTYRFVFQFNTSSKDTFMSFSQDMLVKATQDYRTTDFSFLNMG